jgi:hypothetical protein
VEAEQLAAAQAGADLDDEVVPVEGSAPGQESAEVLGSEHARLDGAEDRVRVRRRFGGSTLRTGLAAIKP